jgi:hypothetical protein
MGNIKNYNFNKLDLKLSNSDYWDFIYLKINNKYLSIGDSFVVWYDFNNSNTYFNNDYSSSDIYSLITWTATNTGYTMDTIGLTGIDNGLVPYNKISGDTLNLGLLSRVLPYSYHLVILDYIWLR